MLNLSCLLYCFLVYSEQMWSCWDSFPKHKVFLGSILQSFSIPFEICLTASIDNVIYLTNQYSVTVTSKNSHTLPGDRVYKYTQCKLEKTFEVHFVYNLLIN